MNKRLSGHIAALFTLIIWGTTFLMSKTLSLSFTTVQILFIRFFIAYFVLCLMSIFSENSKITLYTGNKKDELYLCLAGIMGLSLEAICEIVSMRQV